MNLNDSIQKFAFRLRRPSGREVVAIAYFVLGSLSLVVFLLLMLLSIIVLCRMGGGATSADVIRSFAPWGTVWTSLVWMAQFDVSTMSFWIGTLAALRFLARAVWIFYNGPAEDPGSRRRWWVLHDSFPAYFVRLGFLGTVASFVIYVVLAQHSYMSTGMPTDGALPSSVALPTMASSQVFFLLCSSLVSTLMGCVFAYLVVPIDQLCFDTTRDFQGQDDKVEDPERFIQAMSGLVIRMETLSGALNVASDVLNGIKTTQQQQHECIQTLRQGVDAMTKIAASTEKIDRSLATLERLGQYATASSVAAETAEKAAVAFGKSTGELKTLSADITAAMKVLVDVPNAVATPLQTIASSWQQAFSVLTRLTELVLGASEFQEKQIAAMERLQGCAREIQHRLDGLDALPEELGQNLGRAVAETACEEFKTAREADVLAMMQYVENHFAAVKHNGQGIGLVPKGEVPSGRNGMIGRITWIIKRVFPWF